MWFWENKDPSFNHTSYEYKSWSEHNNAEELLWNECLKVKLDKMVDLKKKNKESYCTFNWIYILSKDIDLNKINEFYDKYYKLVYNKSLLEILASDYDDSVFLWQWWED